MLDYKLLERKGTIKNNNEFYYDLLKKTFDEKATFSGIPLIVNKY